VRHGDVEGVPDRKMMVRPTWRRWLTREEIDDMGRITNYHHPETGEWMGSNLGTTISGCKLGVHTPRTRRKDARWAKRHGYTVDENGIIH
jgi:hypothetical protein